MLKETTANSSLYFNLLQNVGVSLCSTSQNCGIGLIVSTPLVVVMTGVYSQV